MPQIILPPVAGVARIVHKGLLNGLPFVNTFHVQSVQSSFTQADISNIATAMHTAYFNAFIPQLNTQTSLESTTAIDLSSRTGPVAVESTRHPGTIAATTLPSNQSAICISWTIVDRYRGGHPRMYLPLGNATDITVGRTIASAKVTSVGAAADGYLTSVASIQVGGQALLPVCVRYFSQGQLLGTPLQRHITDSVVRTRVDSMRRRTGKETG